MLALRSPSGLSFCNYENPSDQYQSPMCLECDTWMNEYFIYPRLSRLAYKREANDFIKSFASFKNKIE